MNNTSIAVSVYQTIRQRITAMEPSIDDTTLADTLEGLTDFHEIIAAVVRAAVADEALAHGLDTYLHALRDRLERIKRRAMDHRRIARDAMSEVALKKIVAPDFTLSLRLGPPTLTVVEESSIPEPYWEPQKPRLNRLRLIADLKSGATVPGALLSNPQPVLSVRVR